MGLRTWIYEKTGIKLKKFNRQQQIPEVYPSDYYKFCVERDSNYSPEYLHKKNIRLPERGTGFVNPNVVFISNITIGDYTAIYGPGVIHMNVDIGRYSTFASGCTIGAFQHKINCLSTSIAFDTYTPSKKHRLEMTYGLVQALSLCQV